AVPARARAGHWTRPLRPCPGHVQGQALDMATSGPEPAQASALTANRGASPRRVQGLALSVPVGAPSSARPWTWLHGALRGPDLGRRPDHSGPPRHDVQAVLAGAAH